MGGETADALGWYLERVGNVALRTPEQEVDLAKRARAGARARDLLAARPGPQQRARLRRIVAEGRRATDLLVEANLRLVISVARRYRGRGLDFPDLIQEGNLGLLTAVARFDPCRGFRFSTYASWWIRQAMLHGLAQRGRAIRLPERAADTATRLRMVELEAAQRTGSEPDEQELAQRLAVSVERLRDIRRAVQTMVSLDAPVGDGREESLGSLLPDAGGQSPEEVVGAVLLRQALHGVLEGLSSREREVLEQRYGLRDGRERTLQEVGERFGVSRERVRQIELRALGRLSHPRLDGLVESAAG